MQGVPLKVGPKGGRPQREDTNLGVFVLVRLIITWCEGASFGVFDLCLRVAPVRFG